MPEGLKLQRKDFRDLADMIHKEFVRRSTSPVRRHLEAQWQEVDRQIQMMTKAEAGSMTSAAAVHAPFGGPDTAPAGWHSDIEMPFQAYTFETLVDDAVRMLFPLSADWYEAHALLDDDWATRVAETPIHPGDKSGTPLGKVGQEEANAFAQGAIEHQLSRFAFRAAWKLMIAEAYKYGNFVGEMRIVKRHSFTNEFRGTLANTEKLIALIPVSIKHYYLDDGASWVMLEGYDHRPSYIKTYWRNLDDLKRHAAESQDGDGWLKSIVAALEAPNADKDNELSTKGQVQIIEYDGDVMLSRTKRDDAFLPNRIVTVALGSNGPEIVRWRENKYPFRLNLIGYYNRDDILSPYGTSPLVKGQPLQEFISATANNLSDVAYLNAKPPVTYNSRDSDLKKAGGPVIEPEALWPSQFPGDVKAIQIGDPVALGGILSSMIQVYKDLTGVDDPRVRGETKSHTTRFANELAASRNALRTEEFTNDAQMGPITTFLYVLYELTRELFDGAPKTIFVNTRGYQGHLKLNSDLLPAACDFVVKGASGVFSKRERQAALQNVFAMVAQYTPLRLQLPDNVREGTDALLIESMRELGLVAPERFLGGPETTQTGNAEAVVNAIEGGGQEGGLEQALAMMGGGGGGGEPMAAPMPSMPMQAPANMNGGDAWAAVREMAAAVKELAEQMGRPKEVVRRDGETGPIVGIRSVGGRSPFGVN